MFICKSCNKQSKPGEESHQQITESRPRTYLNKAKDEDLKTITWTTEGSEIVKERTVCTECSSS